MESKETVEQAAKKYAEMFGIKDSETAEYGFKAGSEWQAKQMFTREDMLHLLKIFSISGVEYNAMKDHWEQKFGEPVNDEQVLNSFLKDLSTHYPEKKK